MSRVISLLIIIGLCAILLSNAEMKAQEEPVSSTEGFHLEQTITKTTKASKEDKNNWKQKRKENRAYFKTKHLIKKNDKKRTKKIQEIEYLEKRIELKKQQLETYQPTSEKGEKEE